MQLDVMTGVDSLIKQGLVDPDRMVVMGWSAGGHLTNKLVTMTTRFKAASSGAGVADWQSMYAQSDTRDNRTPWFGGTPWQKNAPIGDVLEQLADERCGEREDTDAVFRRRERRARAAGTVSRDVSRAASHGVPTHLYIAPREGHQWQELRHQIFKANTEMAWFEQYALGRDVRGRANAEPLTSRWRYTLGRSSRIDAMRLILLAAALLLALTAPLAQAPASHTHW